MPQISEHWPVMIPLFLGKFMDEFNRPGIESIFVPIEEIDHEWITSLLVEMNRVLVFAIKIIGLFVSSSRNGVLFFNILLKNKLFISGYS